MKETFRLFELHYCNIWMFRRYKGDQLENSESREKAEIGAKWAEMAGRMYKYYMVFETKNPGYNGAYSYEEFMRIVKEL